MSKAVLFPLRDGRSATDVRLDRVPQFDETSRDFPIRGVARGDFQSRIWPCSKVLDQGKEGACVGFGVTHELIAEPVAVKHLDARFARESVYWEAQRIDPWGGGAYPGARPYYEGTSVLAGVKVAQRLGYITSYKWAFGLRDLIEGVGNSGPAVLGLRWFEGLSRPNFLGYVSPTGKATGGHCILCRGIDLNRKRFLLHNSWGASWGKNGTAWITFSSMEYLLKLDGEAVFFTGRKSKAA